MAGRGYVCGGSGREPQNGFFLGAKADGKDDVAGDIGKLGHNACITYIRSEPTYIRRYGILERYAASVAGFLFY